MSCIQAGASVRPGRAPELAGREVDVLTCMIGMALLTACSQVEDDEQRLAALLRTYDAFHLTIPKVQTIEASTLLANRDAFVLVDTRTEEEQAVSRIAGAIPLDHYEAKPTQWGGQQIVTYCTVGVRSGWVARRLRRDGVDVKNLRGSIMAWTHVGGPLVTPSGEPTRQVHVMEPRWDYVADGYVPVLPQDDGSMERLR